jgi:hypothetical protein
MKMYQNILGTENISENIDLTGLATYSLWQYKVY